MLHLEFYSLSLLKRWHILISDVVNISWEHGHSMDFCIFLLHYDPILLFLFILVSYLQRKFAWITPKHRLSVQSLLWKKCTKYQYSKVMIRYIVRYCSYIAISKLTNIWSWTFSAAPGVPLASQSQVSFLP